MVEPIGNIKGDHRAYCFTIYYEEQNKADLIRRLETIEGLKYMVLQQETCPDTGRQHFQGYVVWDSGKSMKFMKDKLFVTHLTVARGTAAHNKAYCSKSASRTPLGYALERGTMPEQGKRTDLELVVSEIKEGATIRQIRDSHPTTFIRYERGIKAFKAAGIKPRNFKPNTILLLGGTGVGKSSWAYRHFPNLYKKPACNEWWDDYQGEEAILLDDFRGGWFPIEYLLRVCDRYPEPIAYKGGFTQLAARWIIITSNRPPHMWYPQDDVSPLLRRIDWTFDLDTPDNGLENFDPRTIVKAEPEVIVID